MKESRRTQMTRMMLRTALIELMQQRPLDQISIKDICQQADLNRTTFYLHYTDQRSLLEDVEQNVKENMVRYLGQTQGIDSALDAITSFLLYIKENALVFQVLFHQAHADAFKAELLRFILSLFWQEAPEDDMDDHYTKTYLICGSIGMVADWIDRSFDLPIEGMALRLVELSKMMVNAIGQNKGS